MSQPAVVEPPNCVKGTSTQAAVAFIETSFGPDAHAAILDELPDELAAPFRGTVLASSWFSITSLNEYMVVADRMFGQSDFALCEACGRFSAYDSLSRIYKLLMKLQNPLGIVTRASRMWRHFNSSGSLEIVYARDHEALVRLTNMPQPHVAHCRRLMGWFQRAAEVAGGKNVEASHPVCRTTAAANCDFILRWQ